MPTHFDAFSADDMRKLILRDFYFATMLTMDLLRLPVCLNDYTMNRLYLDLADLRWSDRSSRKSIFV